MIASIALTVVRLLALLTALGEFGLARPLLPRITTLPGAQGRGGLNRRAIAIALTFGGTMAIFSPLSTYALVIGWVAARRSAWLAAVTLAAYGLGLMLPLAILGRLAARRSEQAGLALEAMQDRRRVASGVGVALAGGFLLSIWTLKATWALFL